MSANGHLPLLKPTDFPAALYRAFEYELGQINVHLCVADAALREFSTRIAAAPDVLAQSLRRAGHRRLNAKAVSSARSLDLSYLSHIGLLLSRMEQLSDRVRRHPFVDRELNSQAKGDFLRRALWVIVASQSQSAVPSPIDDALASPYLGRSEMEKYDTFRTLRNQLFHAGEPDTSRVAELNGPRFSQVLECSKTLQVLARGLCRALVGPPERLIPGLQHRFGSLGPSRRRNAVLAALPQEYLLDHSDAQAVLLKLAW